MAKVLIDVSIFGVEWFQQVRRELEQSPSVVFVYPSGSIGSVEVERQVKLKQFLGLMANKGRLVREADDRVNAEVERIVSMNVWGSNGDCCDDPHIFALVCLQSVGFIFSGDIRLSKCRDRLRPCISSRYCRFKLISTAAAYTALKSKVFN